MMQNVSRLVNAYRIAADAIYFEEAADLRLDFRLSGWLK
jgi:hypothetical protein